MNPEGILVFVLFVLLMFAAIFAPRINKMLGIEDKKSAGE